MVDAVGIDDELVGGPRSDTATFTRAHRFTALGFDAVVTAPFEASARRWLTPSVWFFGRATAPRCRRPVRSSRVGPRGYYEIAYRP